MSKLKVGVVGALILTVTHVMAQGSSGSSTESPAQPSSQGTTRSSGPGLGSDTPGTNATRRSDSGAQVTPDGNKAMGTGVRGGSDSASTSDHSTSRTWSGVGSTGGATGTGTSSGTSDAPSEAAAGGTSSAPAGNTTGNTTTNPPR